MPLFAVIDIESLVQEEDKTRIDVAKSYASGTTPITRMTVKPSKSVDPIDVFADGFLDWQYPFALEVDDENNKIDFAEGAGQLTATLDDGEYTLEELAAEIQTQMLAAGALNYEVSVSADNKLTIAAESEFELLLATGTNADVSALAELQFGVEDLENKVSYKGKEIERLTKEITLTVGNDVVVTPGDPDALPDPIPDVLLSKTIKRTIDVISEFSDRLFSADDRLRKHEADIMKYLPEGRATFKDVHRRAQTLILAWLDTHGFIDNLGNRIKVKAFTDREEVAEWSAMMTLRLIFESVKNAKDDVFSEKTKKYEGLEDFYRNRATIKVNLNGSDTSSTNEVNVVPERLDIRSCVVVRR